MIAVIIRGVVMAFLLFATIALAVYGGFVGWFLGGCSGVVFVYMSVVWLWLRGEFVNERTIHPRNLQAGDEVDVTINVQPPTRYWLCWIMIEERWVHQTSKLEEHYACLVFLSGRRKVICHYKTIAKSRGLYQVHSSRIVIGDMFGLVRRVVVQEPHDGDAVQVMPRPLPESWYKNKVLNSHKLAENGTLREYVAGDRLSTIDWKSYARYQKLMTKQPEVEEGHEVLVIMDGQKDNPNFETLVSAVTRIVMELDKSSVRLTLICGNDRNQADANFSAGTGISSHTYDWLARLEPQSQHSFHDQVQKTISLECAHPAGFNKFIIGVTTAPTDPKDTIFRSTRISTITRLQPIHFINIPASGAVAHA